MDASPSRLRRYGVAVVASAAGLLLRLLLGPAIVPGAFLTSYAAVLVAAGYGGFGPAVLCIALSAAGGSYLFLPLHYPPVLRDWVIGVRIALFASTALLASRFAAALRSARHRLAAAEESYRSLACELEARVAERTAELASANASLREEIAERQRAEEALKDREARFRALAETVAAATFVYRGDQVLYVNSAVEAISGYTHDEVLAMNFAVDPEFRDVVRQRRLARQRGEEVPPRFEFKILTKSGEERWLDFTGGAIEWEGEPAQLGTAFDITDHKRAQAELRKSEERFALVMAGTNDGLWDWDVESNGLYTSPRLHEILGYDGNEMRSRGDDWADLIHPNDLPRVQEAWKALMGGLRTHYEVEYRLRDKAGAYRWVLVRGMSVRDANGKPYRMVGSLADITKRKRAEEALQESEARFRKVFEEGPLGMAIIGVDNRFLSVNNTFCRLVGYSAQDLAARTFADITHPDDVDRDLHTAQRVFNGEIPYYKIDKRYIRRDGETVWVSVTGSVVRDHDHTPLYGIGMVEDITERKLGEDEVRQRQTELAHVLRVATMNQMATGLAHEINQPLSSIVGYAKGCVRRLQSGKETTAELLDMQEKIASEALRAGEVIKRLGDFVRKGPPRRVWTDLNELVRGAVNLVQSEAREQGVTVQIDTAPELPPVHIDPVQIEQVILNLARNGFEAMARRDACRRELSIRTSIATDASLEVAVCDTGAGLPPELTDRVFNPFFTTKPGGLGMGLSISRLIVESHGGSLWASPESGRTTFKFKLPGSWVGGLDGD